MVSLVKNSTKKGAKIQNEYMFLLRCIMATSWIQNLYFITNNVLKVPEKPKLKCLGFTYNGAKLFNMLPIQMKKIENLNTVFPHIVSAETILF